MPLQNRVTPEGEIEANAARGTLMGNRGILHDAHRQLGKSRWKHPAWIACVLAFKGRRRELMRPGRYTELFFTDEAVALAAGHQLIQHEDSRRHAVADKGQPGDAPRFGRPAPEIPQQHRRQGALAFPFLIH